MRAFAAVVVAVFISIGAVGPFGSNDARAQNMVTPTEPDAREIGIYAVLGTALAVNIAWSVYDLVVASRRPPRPTTAAATLETLMMTVELAFTLPFLATAATGQSNPYFQPFVRPSLIYGISGVTTAYAIGLLLHGMWGVRNAVDRAELPGRRFAVGAMPIAPGGGRGASVFVGGVF